jgi:hypothetical protein
MEMTVSLPIYQILKGGFKAGVFVRDRTREHTEVNCLIVEALEAAICPSDADADGAKELASVLAARLGRTDFPAQVRPGLRERALPKALRHRMSGASNVGNDPFAARLKAWVAVAAEAPEMEAALSGFACDEYKVDPGSIATRFCAYFEILLLDQPTKFRTALAKEIQASDAFHEWSEKVKRSGAAAIATTAITGVGATLGAEALEFADPLAIGAGGAILAGAAGARVVSHRWRHRAELLSSQARGYALAWIADVLGQAGGKGVDASDADSLRAMIAELPTLDDDAQSCPPTEVLGDLATRLIPLASEAEDEALVAALRKAENAFVRRRRGRPCSLRDALTALLDVAVDGAVDPACADLARGAPTTRAPT